MQCNAIRKPTQAIKICKATTYTQSGSQTFKETDNIRLGGLPSLCVHVFAGVLGFIFAMFAGYMYVLRSSQSRSPVHYIKGGEW